MNHSRHMIMVKHLIMYYCVAEREAAGDSAGQEDKVQEHPQPGRGTCASPFFFRKFVIRWANS